MLEREMYSLSHCTALRVIDIIILCIHSDTVIVYTRMHVYVYLKSNVMYRDKKSRKNFLCIYIDKLLISQQELHKNVDFHAGSG